MIIIDIKITLMYQHQIVYDVADIDIGLLILIFNDLIKFILKNYILC